MNVEVSDWAWLPLDEFPANRLSRLKDKLTINPRRTSVHQQVDPEPILLFKVQNNRIGVPRGFFFQQNKTSKREHVITDLTTAGREVPSFFEGELKEDQKCALAAVLEDKARGSYGGILRAVPGYGKTVTSLGIWNAMRTTAVVLVQKQFLVDQWIDRIKQFMPGARIGRIQRDKCEFGPDFDISVAMLQTLVRRAPDYPKELWDSFGFVICDETHRMAAPTFSTVAPLFKARYRLGVSATLGRKDGAENVFYYHLGNIVYDSKVRQVVPRVRRVFTSFTPLKTSTFALDDMSKEIQLRHICKSPDRNKLILSELVKAVGMDRKVMILSERRKHLELLKDKYDAVKTEGIVTDFYVGGMKQEALNKAEKADVLFCTYQMAKEALDIPSLDTLFLVTPVSDVEQAVGRIMREYDGKKQPVVTDFIDENVSNFVRTWNRRRAFYVKEGMLKP